MSRRAVESFRNADHLFAGPGPSRAALRGIDWSSTPLGAVEEWPEELYCGARATALSAAPMFLWWGEQFIQLHNDALVGALGDDDPAVGRPAFDCWPERWEVLGPQVEQTIACGEERQLDDVVLPINGAPTSYWTLSLAPLRDDDGKVSGVLASACDLTARVVAHESERRNADATTANLQIALASNRRIGVAIGVLMSQQRITETAAFDLLREASQRTHRKLRDIAEDVVLTGVMPD